MSINKRIIFVLSQDEFFEENYHNLNSNHTSYYTLKSMYNSGLIDMYTDEEFVDAFLSGSINFNNNWFITKYVTNL